MLSAGEEAEFGTFYEKTAEALFPKAYRMCHGNDADAKDAHQRTYIKALEHWPTVRDLTDQQRRAWLARTLMNEFFQIRRAPYWSREAGSLADAERQPSACAGPGDADRVFATDRYRKACRAIARLEGRQHEVIALYGIAGFEISEVAEMLGISEATVRVHLHKGRRRLREIMAREEGSA